MAIFNVIKRQLRSATEWQNQKPAALFQQWTEVFVYHDNNKLLSRNNVQLILKPIASFLNNSHCDF